MLFITWSAAADREIEESYLFAVLKKAYDKDERAARRSRILAAIFRFAIDTWRATYNPAKALSDNAYFKKPKVIHLEAMAREDMPELMTELKNRRWSEAKPQTVCALLMAIYTGLRDHQ